MKINRVVFIVLFIFSVIGLIYIGFDSYQTIFTNINKKSIDLIPVYKSVQITLTNNEATTFEVIQNRSGKYDLILNSNKIYEISDNTISSIVGYSHVITERIIYGYVTDEIIGNINPYKILILENQKDGSYFKSFDDINVANINDFGDEIIVSKILEHKKGIHYASRQYIVNYQLVKKNDKYVLELIASSDKYIDQLEEIKNG